MLLIVSHFGPDLVWSACLPKRTVLQEEARRGIPLVELRSRAARELEQSFELLAPRVEVGRRVIG